MVSESYTSGLKPECLQLWSESDGHSDVGALYLPRHHPLVSPPVPGEISRIAPWYVCAVSGPLAGCRTRASHIEWTRHFLLFPRDLLNQVAFHDGLKLQPCVASQESSRTWCVCPVRHPRRNFHVLHSTSSVKSIIVPDSSAFLVSGPALSVYILCGGQ